MKYQGTLTRGARVRGGPRIIEKREQENYWYSGPRGPILRVAALEGMGATVASCDKHQGSGGVEQERERGLDAKKAGEAVLRRCRLSWVLEDEQDFSKQKGSFLTVRSKGAKHVPEA